MSKDREGQGMKPDALPWFRLYREILNDPKVQRLSGEHFKGWINLLCLASVNAGKIPNHDDVGFALRLHDAAVEDLLNTLTQRGLLDVEADGFCIHGWEGRQHKSDNSAARVRRHREKKACNVTVTDRKRSDETFCNALDTDTDTDYSDLRSGAAAPQLNGGKTDLVVLEGGLTAKQNSSARSLTQMVFESGLTLLQKAGEPEKRARTLLGRWRKEHGDAQTLAALSACENAGLVAPIAHPIEWITKFLNTGDNHAHRTRKRSSELQDPFARAHIAEFASGHAAG